MNTVFKIVREQPVFRRSSVHSATVGQLHAAVTIMAAGNYVPQFPKEVRG